MKKDYWFPIYNAFFVVFFACLLASMTNWFFEAVILGFLLTQFALFMFATFETTIIDDKRKKIRRLENQIWDARAKILEQEQPP